MTPVVVALMALTTMLDVVGQLSFKAGLSRSAAHEGARPLWRRVVGSPWIWAGCGAYAAELAAWLAVLSRAPLSVAFPLASLSYCGVLLASRFVLGEKVPPRRWLGASLITFGVAIVCAGA
jgi:undecaprenyl phosphate-alpha-L-ara4N flippase subunit ArnE